MKKIILIAIIIGLFHIVWYAGSRIYQNRKLPDDKTLREYQDDIMKRWKMNVDRSKLEETYIDANGYKLHLIIGSAGKHAPTLVFIPGTTAYAKVYYQFLYDMYRRGFNVIGFDPRGHGKSSGFGKQPGRHGRLLRGRGRRFSCRRCMPQHRGPEWKGQHRALAHQAAAVSAACGIFPHEPVRKLFLPSLPVP
jgi:hypothetical protein